MTSIDPLEPLRQRRSRLKRLAEEVKALNLRRQEFQRSIADHRAFQPEIESEKIDTLEKTVTSIAMKIADQEVNETNLYRRLQDINATKASPLAVWKYFTDEQKKIRSSASRLEELISSNSQKLLKNRDDISRIRLEISELQNRILEYRNFNVGNSENKVETIGFQIERLNSIQASEIPEIMRIEAKIHPHVQELNRLKSDVSNLMSDIECANRFERELSFAPNSYERAKIHERCEESLGSGRPKQVINDRRSRIRSIESNLSKIERRIRDEIKKMERIIGHLIIDGNNVCYEGQSFIGLQAISALLRELGGRYKTTVVFDASIRSMLKTDNQGIERILGSSVNIHVAPVKNAADEYLIKLADHDVSAFILSNDRFAEYHDFDVVRSGRVLRFLIAEGKIMANDIDISVNF